MEFNCPACDTLHEFPDDEIPPTGVVVACTECGKHITLDGDMSLGDDTAAASLSAGPEELEPASIEAARIESVSVSIDFDGDDADSVSLSEPKSDAGESVHEWPSQEDSRILRYDPLSLAVSPVHEGDRGQRPAARRISKVVEPGSGLSRALDTIGRRHQSPEAIEAESHTPDSEETPLERPSVLFIAILSDSVRGIFDLERIVFATVGFWLTLVSGALLGWIGQWVGQKVAVLGTLLSWSSGLVSMIGFFLICAVLSAQSSRKIGGADDANIRHAIAWIRRSTGTVLGVPFALLGVICTVVIIVSLLGYVGRIPTVGPVIWGVLSSVAVGMSLVAGLAGSALFFATPLYVPIGLESSGSPLEVVKRLAQRLKSRPVALLGSLSGLSVCLIVLMVVAIGPALWIGRRIVGAVSVQTMQGDFWAVVARVPDEFSGFVAFVVGSLPANPIATSEAVHALGAIFLGIGASLGPAFCLAIFMCAMQRGGVLLLKRL